VVKGCLQSAVRLLIQRRLLSRAWGRLSLQGLNSAGKKSRTIGLYWYNGPNQARRLACAAWGDGSMPSSACFPKLWLPLRFTNGCGTMD